jgi:hypothetical protein
MKLKKLFQVLVVGGAALGATVSTTSCGPGSDNGKGTNPLTGADGGTTDGGGGGGPQFW